MCYNVSIEIEKTIMNPLNIISDIVDLIVKLCALGVQLLAIWLVVALFIPSIAWFDHVYNIVVYLFIQPAWFIFELFDGFKESILASDFGGENPIANFAYLLGMLGSIALALALPLAYWFSSAFFVFYVLTLGMKVKPVGEGIDSPAMKNWMHLFNGRTTVDELYAAEVQANAIAEAIKK